MGSRKNNKDDESLPQSRPAISIEARQARMENLALDLIEKRLRDGSASSQETTLYAKSASTRGKIEELRLHHEIELMRAKKTQLESQEELQKMFTDAIGAINNYRIEVPEGDQDIHGA